MEKAYAAQLIYFVYAVIFIGHRNLSISSNSLPDT